MQKNKHILYNKRLFNSLILWFSVLIFYPPTLLASTKNAIFSPTEPQKLTLTTDEKMWLAKHPVITFGGGIYPPLNFINDNAQSVGLAPDYLTLIASRLGITFNLITRTQSEIQALARNNKIDGVSFLLQNTVRQKYLNFAGPYAQLQTAILVNKTNINTTNIASLANQQVAVIAGSYYHYFLNTNYPNIDLLLYKTYKKPIEDLVNKKIKAVVGSFSSISYFIDKNKSTDLKVLDFPKAMATDLYTGVRKDWPEFSVILNKAFASISEKEHQKIRNKWMKVTDAVKKTPQLTFTLKQKKWLKKNKTIRVRVVDLPPYMIVQAGQPPVGIAIDHLNLIAQRTGIKFSYEISEQPFSEFLKDMKKGKGVDLSPFIIPRLERQEYMRFSDSYLESQTVIATRTENNFIFALDDIEDQSVAVLKASDMHHVLLIQYPNIKLILYNSDELALEAIVNGEVDFYVGNLTNTAYLIQKRRFDNIKIIASTAIENQHVSIGNRKDLPELTAIINTALSSITDKEKIAIRNKYVALKYQIHGLDKKEVLIWVGIIFSLALLIVLIFITWNRSLRQLVKSRTSELLLEMSEREKIHSALLHSQEESFKAQKIAHLGYWSWNLSNDKITWSKELYQIFGFSSSTVLTHQKVMQSIHPDDRQSIKENDAKWLRTKTGDKYEFRIIKADGSFRYIYAIAEVECNDKAEVTLLFGTMQDISERKKNEQILIQYQHRLKSLALQKTLVEEQERRHIAADLHDNVGQSLALTRLQLAAVLKRLPKDDKTAELIRNSSQSILTAIQETRHLIFEISSPSLNELGLGAAIIEWKEQTCEQHHGLQVNVIDQLTKGSINLNLRAILFRNVRELLVNAIKHAQATTVMVLLNEKLGHGMITVQDNGIGFIMGEHSDRVSVEGGFGLFSIQERMIDIGGEMIINSAPQQGCTIVMKFPMTDLDNKINAK